MIGMTLGHYQITNQLGKGGMGEVYQAKDQKLGRDVAIKVLPEEFAGDADRIARFQREAKLLASLNHPNIATIYGLEESSGTNFLVLELVEGQTLADRIKAGPIPVEESLRLALQITEALEAAHEKGIIHRDLKPANIKITPEGKVKVLDFGLAKAYAGEQEELNLSNSPTLSNATTQQGIILGTVAYMSPEQALGQELDTRTDLFSLGVLLYEMATGILPFRGNSATAVIDAILHQPPDLPPAVKQDLSSELRIIIHKCLEKDRARRYGSARELEADFRELNTRYSDGAAPSKHLIAIWRIMHLRQVFIPLGFALLLVLCFALWFVWHLRMVRWAEESALTEITRLSVDDKYFAAFRLARQADKYINSNPKLIDLWPKIGERIDIETVPAGAEIFYKEYSATEEPWIRLGFSPLKSVLVPRGYKRWLIRKPGYVKVESAGSAVNLVLDAEGNIPPEMVRVEAGRIGSALTGLATDESIQIDSFLIDRYEVTNREYKKFVDSGGYRNRNYWKYEFMKDGHVLDWEQGIAQFKDATGREGPSTWESAMYPQGEDELPVQGVSWYEAAAYAQFVGKMLPSLYHWSLAAGFGDAPSLLPLSNFSNKGPIPVGRSGALSHSGAYDMAGNVREWIWTSTGDLRYLLGGAGGDPNYMFRFPNARSPFDRSTGNGFRCARYITHGPQLNRALQSVPLARVRDYRKVKPVADNVYRIYESQFAYDHGELDAKVEGTDDRSQYWNRLKVSFSAAYGHERVTAFLFLPKNIQPPHQTVVFFPGAGAIIQKSSDTATLPTELESIIKSGRALAWPVYKGTFERNDGLTVNIAWQNETVRFKDYLIKWVMDFRKTIDYLETRPDIDANRLGYLGTSWGAVMGAIIPAIEKRLKINILLLGGVSSGVARPEVDQLNFVSHVRIPTLMLNGRYDQILPMDTAQQLLYRMLGTPQEQKRYVVYDTGHSLPSNAASKEILAWLDRYLGSVQ